MTPAEYHLRNEATVRRYLEVADQHREAIEAARRNVAHGEGVSYLARALVAIDNAMRSVVTDDR